MFFPELELKFFIYLHQVSLLKKALVKIKNREIVFKQIDLINKKISSRNQLVFMPSH